MDPRAERTVSSLQDAMLALVAERNLSEITVSALTEAAGVNRSTFYQHYADTEEVLADALDELMAEFPFDVTGIDLRTAAGAPPTLQRYVEHIDANRTVYRRALGGSGSAPTLSRLLHRIEDATKTALNTLSDTHTFIPIPVDVFAAATGGCVLGMLVQWLESDHPASAQEEAQWIWAYLTQSRRD